MDYALVIKVKYGDTLRRFSARVDENNRLDLDMVGLRAKICSIFSFSADVNFSLRYVDEDGDLVTLVDDDDLRDVMRQQLKFLKIDVHMNNGGGGKSNAGSSGSATPLRSPPVTNPFLGRDAVASSPVPEHLVKALSKLSLPKAASSSHVVEKLASSILKIGESVLNTHFQPHVAAGTSSKSGVTDETITSEAVDPKSPHVNSAANANVHGDRATPLRAPVLDPSLAPLHELISALSSSSQLPVNVTDLISLVGQSVLNSYCQPHVAAGPFQKNGVPGESITSEAGGPQIPSVDPTSNATQQVDTGNLIRGVVSASNASQQVEAGNVIRGATTAAGVATVDLNIPACDPYLSQSTDVNKAPLTSEIPDSDGKKGKMSTVDSVADKGDSSGTSSSSADHNTQTTTLSSGAFIDCPFSGTCYSWTPSPLGNSHIPPFKRSHSHTEAMTGMFHKGVRCDGCGVYPITGPRFKSKVKENYDLCSICFNEMGNGTDYIRMDRPASTRAPHCIYYEHAKNLPVVPPPIFKKGALLKHAKPKLDSKFILDVNVIDGTMMAPSTAFTKIWRMRNNGTIMWPKGTQLVWIGGHKLSDSRSVNLEVPEVGVPMEKELDIAVDFTAPQFPGRYVSYWRMATPSGHKFGQRVWVLIQVDASLKDSFYDSSQGLNLNTPLDVSGSKAPHVIDINVQPIEDDTYLQTHYPNAPIEPVNHMVDKEPMLELENEFPINEATFVAPVASTPAVTAPAAVPPAPTSSSPSSVSYPIIDLSETATAVPSNQQSSTVDVPSSSEAIGGINSVEENLLKELEEMGFKQVDLNKEILRMNEYDLEQSLDDLCGVDIAGVSEWDPILEELQEMGFRDKETNKRLLKKNNGSIKRVVMDLINGE